MGPEIGADNGTARVPVTGTRAVPFSKRVGLGGQRRAKFCVQ
jgi:hypothetical protein